MFPLDATDDLPPVSENLPPISEAPGSRNATVESSPPAPLPPPVLLPERIGPYKLLKKIGEGGMGMVYLAEQEQPRRLVALKILKPGTANLERLRRFEHETRALARLQHDGVARIYQAGQIGEGEQAQPYFAMEFIDGRPLTVYADSQRLSVPQRLSLIVRICRAVQHAHMQGVVHRDLKPANILVENDGQPKVLDFGVALVCDENQTLQTLQTVVGQLIGTVRYMSPEQAEADPDKVDWRSDIYALGVICYELLTGRLPHDLEGKTALSAVQIIREEEPTPLSSISKAFRGDLNTIVAKALDKNKERRYQSAADFAGDLEHYLRDEPITARPAGPVYKFRKFAKRNKAKVAMAVLLFLALVVGIPLMALAAIQRERADTFEKEKIRLEAEGFARDAKQAHQHGHWREALTNFGAALQAGYANPTALRLGKIRALLELNETRDCEAEIEELAKAPNGAEGSLLLLRGELLLSENNAEAEQFIRAALAKQLPPSEKAYIQALLAETTPKAVEHLRETLALDPYHHRARVNLEFLLLFLARFDETRSELYAHQVIFPNDDDLPLLETLLLALEGKRSEAQASLTRLKHRLDAADLAAFGEVTDFLCQFRNPANRPEPVLGLPDLSKHWQAVQPALRRLWPALAIRDGAKPLAPPRLHLISRLPPRLRKNLEGLPHLPMTLAGKEEVIGPNLRIVIEAARAAPAAEIHPEGTITYLWAMALLGAQRWEEANQAAEKAANLPALLPVYPAAMNIAASSKSYLYALFRRQPDPLLLPRAIEATLLSHRPAFFAAAATHGVYFASRNALLPRALANLREMLAAQQPHRPLMPEIAVNLALLAGEYSLARQLLDDWERDAPRYLNILQLRAFTEWRAGAYLPALKAAEAYLKRKPDDAQMQQFKKQIVQELGKQAQPYLPDALPKRKP